MKTTLFMLLACCIFSCQKSVEVTQEKLSVTDLGVNLNSTYRVQQMQQGQFVEMTEPSTVKWLNDRQVSEKRGIGSEIVNDYMIKGKGSASSQSLLIDFPTLSSSCEFNNCPVIVNDSRNAELYRDGGNIVLIKHEDSGDKMFRFVQ